MNGAWRKGAVVCVAAALLTACSSGHDAVTSGGTFDFVSPGGKTEIFYDPPRERGTIGVLSGPDLLDPSKTLSARDFAGKVVVLNIWGQWCGPCRGEVGGLQRVYEQTRGQGVEFLGIDVRDSERDKAKDFVTDRALTYPSIWDPAMRSLLALGGKFPTSVIPTTLVLDRQQRVAAVFLRSVEATELRPVVERIAKEK